MKDILFFSVFAMLLFWAGITKAQRPVGDTITGRDSTFFYYPIYDWIGDDSRDWSVIARPFLDIGGYSMTTDSTNILSPNGPEGPSHYFVGNGIWGAQMYTDRPLKVVGIAAPAYMQEPNDTAYSHGGRLPPRQLWIYLNTRDTTLAGRATDSMILYKPTEGGDLVKLMDAPWRIENPHRYIVLPPMRSSGANNNDFHLLDSTATSYTAPLYEVMFEKPVVVEDSFVVAITTFNNEGHRDWEYDIYDNPYYMWLWDHNPTRFFTLYERRECPTPGNAWWFKYRTFEWRVLRGDDTGTARSLNHRWWRFQTPLLFPIIEPGFDTTLCHEVSNLRVAEHGAGCATLMWDAGDGGPWIVAYGKVDDAWEDFIFDTVSSPMITLTGLEVGTQYFALVRGYCGVTEEYGEWSSPLEVEIYHPGSGSEPEGIDRPGDLGRFTRLMPNPARERVSVLSSYKMSRIEVYALDGRKVLEQEVGGISTVMEVKDLPRGTYIVAVYLPHGVATKKLVLE